MPQRKTKRGSERTPLAPDADVLICGASFAGLAVARELRGSGARVLMLDRYEVGERQTSACAAPTEWLEALGLKDSIRQTFSDLVIHTPHGTFRYGLPWTFSTFDYPELCSLLYAQGDAEFDRKADDDGEVPVVVVYMDTAGSAFGSTSEMVRVRTRTRTRALRFRRLKAVRFYDPWRSGRASSFRRVSEIVTRCT